MPLLLVLLLSLSLVASDLSIQTITGGVKLIGGAKLLTTAALGVRSVSTVDLLEPGSSYDVFVDDMLMLRGRANFVGTGESDIDFTWQFDDGGGFADMPTSGSLDVVIKGPSTDNPELSIKVEQATKEDWRYVIPVQADTYQVRLQVVDHNNGDAVINSSAVTVTATTWTGLNTRALPPQVFVKTRFPDTLSGSTTTVGAGENLQTALNAAACGDTLKLEVGATFIGNFVLQRNECGCAADPTKWIMIRSAAADSDLPDEDERFDPATHGSFAPIILTDGPVATLETDNASTAANTTDCYYFFAIKFECTGISAIENFWCVRLGANTVSIANEPQYFIFDRVWFHGDELQDFRRALYVSAANHVAVINSYIDEWSSTTADCQGILIRQGFAFEIVNNFNEGSAEPIMMGGVTPKNLHVPSDAVIRRNHHSHPNNWNPEHPSWDGRSRSIKNLLEFKNAMRVHIEGNQLNNNWAGSQSGTAVLFTPRNDDGGCSWCTVHDVVFQYNLIFDTGRGFLLAGRDDILESDTSWGIHVENNLWYNIDQGVNDGTGDGILQNAGSQHDNFIEHNTFSKTNRLGLFWGNPGCLFTVRDITLANNGFDVDSSTLLGDGQSAGQPSIDACMSIQNGETIVENNGVVNINVTEFCDGGSTANHYPSDHVCVTGSAAVLFTDRAANDFSLQGGSPWVGAGNDGKDIGADITKVLNKTSGVQ